MTPATAALGAVILATLPLIDRGRSWRMHGGRVGANRALALPPD